MNPTQKPKGGRYIVIDTQATTPNHMRRNSAINPRYWVWDTVTQKVIDETTHKSVATLTARQMNKCCCPSVACPIHGLPNRSASGGW